MSRFINGNSQEILKSYPTSCVDLILTDPPYLVNFKDRSGRTIKNDKTGEWLAPIFNECYRVLKNDSFCVSFYGWNKVDQFFKAWKQAGFRVVGHLIFVKKYASNSGVVNYKHESAYVLAKGFPKPPKNLIDDVIEWEYTGNKLHPTQKPISNLKTIINSFSKEGDIVLDPFAGSASTCHAAFELKRRFIGIELDEKYFKLAEQELKNKNAI